MKTSPELPASPGQSNFSFKVALVVVMVVVVFAAVVVVVVVVAAVAAAARCTVVAPTEAGAAREFEVRIKHSMQSRVKPERKPEPRVSDGDRAVICGRNDVWRSWPCE